jgi:hypothetical protein
MPLAALFVTVAAYIAVAVLLLSLNLTSRWRWWVKGAAIAITTIGFVGTYFATAGLIGWPTNDRIPERFSLLWAEVKEPNKRTGDEGYVYLWVEALDDYNLPSGPPRAYEIPYSKTLAENTWDAVDRRQDGWDILGTANSVELGIEDISRDAARASGDKAAQGVSIDFQQQTPVGLIAKN